MGRTGQGHSPRLLLAAQSQFRLLTFLFFSRAGHALHCIALDHIAWRYGPGCLPFTLVFLLRSAPQRSSFSTMSRRPDLEAMWSGVSISKSFMTDHRSAPSSTSSPIASTFAGPCVQPTHCGTTAAVARQCCVCFVIDRQLELVACQVPCVGLGVVCALWLAGHLSWAQQHACKKGLESISVCMLGSL